MNRLRFRIAAGVALGLATLFAVCAALATWAVQISTEAVVQERLAAARQTAATVDALLQVAQHQLEALAAEVEWEAGGGAPAARQQRLSQLQHLTGTFDNLGVLDPRGNVIWAFQPPEELQGWRAAAFPAMAQGVPAFGQQEGPQPHPALALLAVPLRAPSGHTAGALAGTLRPAHMGTEILSLSAGEAQVHLQVVDSSGNVLAAAGAGHPATVAGEHLALLGPALRGGYEATAVHHAAGGHVVAYAPVKRIAGGVLVEQQNDLALAVPRALQRTGLFVGSVALLLISLGTWWHARRLTGPLEELTEAARVMARGVFDQPVPWKGTDEIGLLGASLERLRTQVQWSLETRQHWEDELERQVAERSQRVHVLLGKIISAQEEERQRIARELHDGAAQHLTTLLMTLDSLKRTWPQAHHGGDLWLARAETEGRIALQELRRLMLGLRPADLDDLGLVSALRWHVEIQLTPHGIAHTFTVRGSERRLDPALEIAIFRIAQEAITNSVRHSAARLVEIAIEFGDETLGVVVHDDGCGFDASDSADRRRGVGLDGMQQRAALAGGSLEIRSRPGEGTWVTAAVPALPVASTPEREAAFRQEGAARVLIADDHTLFRQSLHILLERSGEFTVVGEAANGKEALDQAAYLRPDLLVMNIAMPVMDGLSAARALRARLPALPILFLTLHDADDSFFQAIAAGASGYLSKDAVGADLEAALRVVRSGGVYLSPSVAGRLVEEYLKQVALGEERKTYELLTPREREILNLIGQGNSNKEIAEQLTISVNTVQSHRLHIIEKLNLHSRAELMKYAVRFGLLREEPEG